MAAQTDIAISFENSSPGRRWRNSSGRMLFDELAGAFGTSLVLFGAENLDRKTLTGLGNWESSRADAGSSSR